MRERVREGKSPPPSIFFLPGWPFGTYARRAMKGGKEFQESPTKIEKGHRRGKNNPVSVRKWRKSVREGKEDKT